MVEVVEVVEESRSWIDRYRKEPVLAPVLDSRILDA